MKASQYLFLSCSLVVCGAPAQDPRQGPAEVTSHEAPATFSSKVNLVSVPVVVRDSKGHAVGNLRQEDFRLFDKGKQQVITKFSVQQNISGAVRTAFEAGARATENADTAIGPLPAAPPKPTLPDRYAAYVFDDVHLTFEELAHVRAAAEQHFSESPAPTSRGAIYTTSGRVTLDFTNDREKLHEALLRIAPSPSAAELPGIDCPDIIGVYQADLILSKGDSIASGDAALELQKCLPKEAITGGTVISYSEMALAANNLNTRASMNIMANVVRRISVMPGSRSIVFVSPGFMTLSDSHAEEMELLDRAIRSNIVINSLDARGLYTALGGEAGSSKDTGLDGSRTPDGLRMRYMRAEADADKDVMAELADGTGGKFFENDNGLKEGLDELAAPPEYTYVLGFSPQNLKFDGSYHALKVTLVHPKGLELQVRRGYWAPNRAADAAGQAREEIQEAVFSIEEVRDIPVDVTTEFFRSSDAMAELTVEAHLDLNGLKFKTAGDRNEDTLTVVTGLFDQDGRYVKGIQRVIDLRLREQTLEKVLGSGMAVKETFDIAPGRYVVRVVVRDSEGQTMAARNGTVDIR
jgi:VWFA-related protein